MAAYTRKQYSGAARNTTTTTLLTNVGTTVDIAATTGWPSIAGIPFYVVLNPSSIYEEKCLATISGSTLTLVRAQDDTTASEHPIGSVIYPVFTANDADEANELVSKLTTKGDLLTTDGNNLLRLGVGTNGYFLKASSSASAGIEWASIPTINSLDDVGDVTISNIEGGDFLVYDSSASVWANETIHFITVSDNPPTDEVAEGDLWYNSIELELYTYYSGSWVQMTDTQDGIQELYELVDVLITDPVSGETLVYNGTEWENGIPTASSLETARIIALSGDVSGSVLFDGSASVNISTTLQPNSIALGVDTTGNYVSDLAQGTGVTITHTPGEGSSPTVAIGQNVATSASVTFAAVTAPLTGNSSTATTLQTARTIALSGDVSGSVSFDGSASVSITTTIEPNSVALGTDTTGDYIASLVAGTNISISNNSGEGATPTISVSGSVSSVDSISSPDFIQFDTTANTTPVTGLLGWDSVQGTLNLGLSANKHIHIGEESLFRVRNATGTTIGKGTALYASGVEPSGRIQVTPYVADGTVREVRFMGLAAESIADGVNGFVQHFGHVRDLDTRGTSSTSISVGDETWAAGDILYVHPTVPGKLTNVAPRHAVVVALLIVRHQTTGWLFVRSSSGGHIEDIHDIVLTSPTDGQFLRYNSASTVWVNDAINLGTDTVGNYLSDLTQGTGVTITHTPSEGSNATIAIGQAVDTSASVTFAQVNTTGDLVVGGDLTVNGTTTTLNTETLEIEDNIIVLNSNVSTSPVLNAGIEIQRGTSDNVSIRWNETSDKWEITEDGSAYLEIGTTADISAAALTSISDIPDVSTAYQLGATGPAGGIIFITPDTVGNSTGMYFEAAPSASQVQRSWATGGNQSSAVSGADATAIGFGSQNTIDIVAQSGNVSATSAAAYASGYEYGGFSDWFLPSLDELQELYAIEDLDPGTIPGLLGSNYWSSTEHSATQAKYENLGDGGQGFSAKSNALYVRPVRAFNSPASGDFLKWNGSYWTNDQIENALTATTLQTARTISLGGDLSGSVSFNGSSDVTLTATVAADSVALGTDTTGNYMSDLTQGTGVTITHTPGEGSNATVAIGQAVDTSASVTFANVTATGNVAISGRIDKTTIRESVADASVSAGVVTANYATGDILYLGTAPSSNFTVNLTNAPTDNGKAITVVLFVTQGATGYYPSVVQVAGIEQEIKWANFTSPTPSSGNSGAIDIFSFTFVRRSSAWTVFGSSNLGYMGPQA